jgi:hypothetical protein
MNGSGLRRRWRLVAAAALAAWIAAAVWIVALLVSAASDHPGGRFTAVGELLLPALLFAVVALLCVLIPRRLSGAWVVVFLFSLVGLPAWIFLRSASYGAAPWVSSEIVTAAVWMCLGLALGLIALSLLALRGVPEPADVHIAAQFTGSPQRAHAEQVSGGEYLVEREPPRL